MIKLEKIIPEAIYNNNIYPSAEIGYTVVGSAGSIVSYDNHSANKKRSVKFVSVNSTSTLIDFTEAIAITTTGIHAVSFSFFKNSPLINWEISLNVYKDGVLFVSNTSNVSFSGSGFIDNNWNVYSQNFNFSAGQVITFSFQAICNVSDETLLVSSPKIELLNKCVSNATIYTYPLNFFQESADFTQIETDIQELKQKSGSANYVDTQYTSASPFVINANTTAILPCNGLTKNETQTPLDYIPLFDTVQSKLKAYNIEDSFLVNIRFKARTTVNNDSFKIRINIGGAIGNLTGKTLRFDEGANSENEFNEVLYYFTRATFISNGGTIEITTKSGILSIYDIQINPVLLNKAQ